MADRVGDLFDAGMAAYTRFWLVRSSPSDLVAAVIDAVEPLIRADERERVAVELESRQGLDNAAWFVRHYGGQDGPT
jgi:hypothetical protein